MKLTASDFDDLMEAIDVWAEYGGSNEMMAHLVMASMRHGDNHDAAVEEIKDYHKTHQLSKMTRKEQAIVLKAKLVYLKREIETQQLFGQTIITGE